MDIVLYVNVTAATPISVITVEPVLSKPLFCASKSGLRHTLTAAIKDHHFGSYNLLFDGFNAR